MTTGAILMVLGIISGALGAHALRETLSPDELISYETAVRYHIYMALAFIALSGKAAFTNRVFRIMLAGVLLFSGSIYLLVLDEHIGFSASSVGFITPIGGALLILSWGMLVFNIVREKSSK